MAIFIKLNNVAETDLPSVYLTGVTIDFENGDGPEDIDYSVNPTDSFGLGPTIREAVNAWITEGNPVTPYSPPPITEDQVNRERDRRMYSRFSFNAAIFDIDKDAIERINGAATNALTAITLNNAQAGDLRWHGGTSDFIWIAADNTAISMDAPTVIQFGQAAAAWVEKHIMTARAIKDQAPIPNDYAADARWPATA